MRSPRRSAGTSRRRKASIAASPSTWAMAAMSRRAAEISVTDGNKIKMHRIVAATDPGYAVNPAQIERQIAGSFVYGLTGLFYGGCTVKDGRIEQTNFDTYNSMRIAEMPKVEIDRHAERRLLGRRRRADHLRGGARRCSTPISRRPASASARCRCATRTSPSPDPRAAASDGRRSMYRNHAHGRAAPDDAEKRRSRHRGGGGVVCLAAARPARNPPRASS